MSNNNVLGEGWIIGNPPKHLKIRGKRHESLYEKREEVELVDKDDDYDYDADFNEEYVEECEIVKDEDKDWFDELVERE